MIRSICVFAIRRPIVVLALRTAVVGAGFRVGIGVLDRLESAVGTVPSSESARAEDRLTAPETQTAVTSSASAADPSLRTGIADAIVDVRAISGVALVSEPLPSAQTGRALLVEVTLAPESGQEDAAQSRSRMSSAHQRRGESRQGLDIAPGSGFEHMPHKRTE